MNTTLRQFQLEELAMLKAMAACLEEAGVPFYLLGGSCIGALRHRGFIPWDDDVDIAILRRDFDAAEAALTRLQEPLLYDPVEHHRVPDGPLGHIYTTAWPLEQSPRIDVFAIDHVPDSRFWRRYQKLCANIYHVCVLRRPAENRGRMMRWLTALICKLPAWLLNAMQRKAYKGITRWKDRDTACVSNLFGVRGEKERVPAAYYGTPRFVPFEDT
ncbi:MAG: LicD family protein, partial [Clostridia bacterium]|nr:LicD family protein [Clostridia bacterium]